MSERHEGQVMFGVDRDSRNGTLHVRCACGWRGPEHKIESDTTESVARADDLCTHDFRVHIGWRVVPSFLDPNKLLG